MKFKTKLIEAESRKVANKGILGWVEIKKYGSKDRKFADEVVLEVENLGG